MAKGVSKTSKTSISGVARPFLKWAGGKKQLIPEISQIYPFDNPKIKKYVEPFVGGGAILFHVLNNYDLDAVVINDANQELINCYEVIKTAPADLISNLAAMQSKYLKADDIKKKEIFNSARSRFNALKKECILDSNKLERATLMIFLNRTCFNGLYRENSSGDFNVPVGRYNNPIICDEDNLKKVSKVMQNVEIRCGDYHGVDDFIDDSTFVYFDPPYRPIKKTSNFNSYTKNNFNDESQRKLAEYFRNLSERGAIVALSNSDPKNLVPDDDFFDNLYSGFNIKHISASRMINSKAEGRGKINELLITN